MAGGSRFMHPVTPGGVLSPASGSDLTPTEELTLQNIANGTYFVENETPTGLVNGSNTAYNTANQPSPTSSLEVYLNGQLQHSGGVDYTFSGTTTITFNVAPPTTSIILVNYRRQP